MLKVVEKMWERLRESLWENGGKVLHMARGWFSFGDSCEKVEKFSRSISTNFWARCSLFGRGLSTFST